MAFTANYEFNQGTDCSKFTITDKSVGYQGSELLIVSQGIPASPPTYTRIMFRFTSPFFTGGVYNKEVVISNGQNAATVHAAITAAFNGDTTIAALFTATNNTTSVSLIADKDFIYTELDVILEDDNYFTDVAITETVVAEPKADERSVNLTYADGTIVVIPFPYENGYNDELEVEVDKDYALLCQMIFNNIGVYEKTQPIVMVCNTDSYIRELGVEYDNRADNQECSEALREKWSLMYDYRTQAVTQASIERIQLSQSFLDRALQLHEQENSNCCN
jgi:hypothetical protein